MADNSSLGVNLGGGAPITVSGATNAAVLQSLASFLTNLTVNGSKVTFPAAPVSKATLTTYTKPTFASLASDPVVALSDTLIGVNLNGHAATVAGGGTTNVVVATGAGSTLNFAGAAGNVYADGSSGSITDTGAATITATNGVYNVVGTGVDSFLLGGGTSSVTAHSLGIGSKASLAGGVSYYAGASDTIAASGGNSSVYSGGSDMFFSTGNNMFSSKLDASTFIGGTGADTIFTSLSQDVIFVGTTSDLVVTQGGSDSLIGGSVAPTVFAGVGENLILASTAAGGVLVDNGRDATINGAGSSGGNQYFASASFGNGTLVGAVAGAADSFYISNDTASGATITILDFHTGDGVYLTGFSAADTAKAAAAVSAGSSSFTLSDGTTLTFVGNHPTGGSNGHLT